MRRPPKCRSARHEACNIEIAGKKMRLDVWLKDSHRIDLRQLSSFSDLEEELKEKGITYNLSKVGSTTPGNY